MKFRFTTPAMQDVVDIAKYIARDNPHAAEKMIERLESESLRLFEQPDRGMHHDELPNSMLVYSVGSYLIIYKADSEEVAILRIVHAARDLRRLFPESL